VSDPRFDDHMLRTLISETLSRALEKVRTPELRPGTVADVVGPMVLVDGDTVPVEVPSLIGPVPAGQRVMVLFHPPAGAVIIGVIGAAANGPVSGGKTGATNAGPTSGTTSLTFDTITLPAPGIPGRLHAWSNGQHTKTVGTDRFSLVLLIDGDSISNVDNQAPDATTSWPWSMSGSAAIDGASDAVITATITRASGTGTASIAAATRCVLHYIFIPD